MRSNQKATDVILWEDLYVSWTKALQQRENAQAQSILNTARKRIAMNDSRDWMWIEDALSKRHKKYFVAKLFEHMPVPKRLFQSFVMASLINTDASSCREYIEPLVETYGRSRIVQEFDNINRIQPNLNREIESARYWTYTNSGRRRGLLSKQGEIT